MLGLADLLDRHASEGLRLAQQLRALERELYRRKPLKRAPRQRRTPPREAILRVIEENPNLDQMGVAEALRTNAGRVSEAFRGKRA